jgi:hypothetical protein
MAVLYSEAEREMDCPKEVVIWNYFDHEHVVGTHYKNYSQVKVLAEEDGWCLVDRAYKLPVINYKTSSVGFMHLIDPHHIKSYQMGKMGLLLDQDIYFEDLPNERCRVKGTYRMEVPPGFGLLQPLWEKMTKRWFDLTWDEDAPMRLRRWKVWKLGFRDFRGIPYINEKKAKPNMPPRPYPVELPTPKITPIKGQGVSRIFEKSDEVGYSRGDG